eukprot:gene184-317_t
MYFPVVFIVVFPCLVAYVIGSQPIISDEFVPNDCPRYANPSDHLLIEFRVTQAGMTVGPSYEPPGQLFHILLDQSDALPIQRGLKGMCENATRVLKWDSTMNLNLNPLITINGITESEESELIVSLKLHHITDSNDYQIIDAFKTNNISLVLDLITEQKGINALDEWGQTSLMIAVQKEQVEVVAALLNARMPKVMINTQKSSGYTALFYAVELKTPMILKALLRRGADPNVSLLQQGARGNTPLHFACLMEKAEHAAQLLEFGANTQAVNEWGMTPLQMLPGGTVPSIRMKFKKLFEDAKLRLTTSPLSAPRNGPSRDL